VIASIPSPVVHRVDLLRELVGRDIKVRYRRNVLGMAWSQLGPLSLIVALTLVFTRVLPLHIEHYAAFVFIGVLVWTWFSSAIVAGTESVVGGGELVRTPRFRVALLPVAAVTTHLIQLLLALPILLGTLLVTTGRVPVTIVALPAILAVQFILTLGPCYALGGIDVHFRDTAQIVSVILLPLFYVTPVFYAVPSHFQWAYDLNPLARLLVAYRDAALYGRWPDPVPLLVLTAIGAVLIAAGYALFVRAGPRFAEEL
jgi:lipopolysaccharide transport system permease protein